ncbi:hypothetical protein [Tenuibacillus multivorans]|uniref:Uncharacterized protein n=1 Tax=Tenuibacillus multivorans TaxID=237069 RepID=A0A1H0AP00_9BACI|nr:hypothetical protein [Tenuibacillus multivorans]GEL78225.1 hypothetical protein TMU01_24600 [Tenuibacillus multivorans]SDN35278.1 hypothetical protein SAMN05216498_2018 [Tenuibacillus multivorans]
MSDFTVRIKDYVEQARDYTVDRFEALKNVSKDVWLKNSPALGLLFIYLLYLMFSAKEGSIAWTIIFLIGFGYAIFAIKYWKKDQEFNLNLSLVLLLFSFAFAGFEGFSFLISSLYERVF